MAKFLDQESLFSLELVVERLSLPNVTCRFPAIAFRLLDFPTLIVYHVEPDLADTIRAKIKSDPYYKLPPQLTELQDKQGNFPVKKGKSCLFKVTANQFQSHLATTPLYVMLIDTYPEVPKLIGSCTVPLDTTMDELCDDICKQGISVPAVHGERGEYRIFNLMGCEIGTVAMGHRLLSLGQGLIQHIPDRAIAKRGVVKQVASVSKDGEKAMETADVIIQDIQAADKDVQVAINPPAPKRESQNVQTDAENLQATGTQTDKKSKGRRARVPHKKRLNPTDSNDVDDFFITNTVCPPPLFYNSEVAEPEVTVTQGLTFADYPNAKSVTATYQTRYTVYSREYTQQPESYSEDFTDDDTIRAEDKFSDSDVEEYVDFDSSRIIRTESSGKDPLRKTIVKKTMTGSKADQHAQPVPSGMVAPGVFGALSQFPMLNTLLNEIVALQHVQSGVMQHQPVMNNMARMQQLQQAQESNKKKPTSRPVSPPGVPETARDRGNREEIMARLATPRKGRQQDYRPESGRHSHRECSTGDTAVPKNKSWLRKQPTYGVKKTKLAYGMTNTQRLRLAKGNPELLKTLEKAEEQRKLNKGIPVGPKAGQDDEQKQPAPGVRPRKGSQAPVPTRRKKSAQDGEVPPLPVYSSMEETGDMSVKTSTEWTGRRHKKPVPTPRLSRQWTKELLDDGATENGRVETKDKKSYENGYAQEAEPHRRPRAPLVRQRSRPEEEPMSTHSEPRSQSKSIEVHMPSATQDHEDDATDAEGSEFGDEGKNGFGRTRTLYNPGFPEEPRRNVESRQSDYQQYSDDFESEKGMGYSDDFEHTDKGADSFEEPSLRKVVDKYSDDDSMGTGQEPELRRVVDTYSDNDDPQSGAEPSLRKVVDQYSDHSSDKTDGFLSARSEFSEDSRRESPRGVDQDLKVKIPAPTVNPSSSVYSPQVAVRHPTMATREPVAESGTTVDPGEIQQVAVSESFESTAYISRSQVPSVGTSLESTGGNAWRRPRPSPRRALEKLSSIRTDSVSSYAPSDPDNISLGDESYSDDFSDEEETTMQNQNRNMNSLKVTSEAKLGYTWT